MADESRRRKFHLLNFEDIELPTGARPEIAAQERHARDLGADPWPSRTSPEVALTGDPLTGPIHWRGAQWAVTGLGVEALDGSYPIEVARLWEDEDSYGWVRHMADKNWVDLAEFAEALRIARRLHQARPY